MSWINSLTSLPRSPTNPTTTTSAEVPRVIMPINTLLPTPLPANKPIRCPKPTVTMELIALTPTSKGCVIALRNSGFIGGLDKGTRFSALIGPKPSKGWPLPSTTRPSNSIPTAKPCSRLRGCTREPGTMPLTASVGIR